MGHLTEDNMFCSGSTQILTPGVKVHCTMSLTCSLIHYEGDHEQTETCKLNFEVKMRESLCASVHQFDKSLKSITAGHQVSLERIVFLCAEDDHALNRPKNFTILT